MSHSKQVNRTIDLSIHDVYRVASGETFLLTDEGMVEPTESQIIEAERKVLPDGRVWARVGVRASQKELEELSKEGEKPLAFQETYVSQPDEAGAFEVNSTMELPLGMGTMETHFVYAAVVEDAAAARQAEYADSPQTAVEATLTADVSVPLIAGRLEKHLLKTADTTVDNGLARIVNLSGA
ncbi:DUF2505 domain-containing protein [Corynebacterium sp. YSMAA1_1_F7]|uniref:DUF2505 domain-containing protein n=1 Tax=Corynebacterium sp. YSMAA1_1_F7 TaxID=3383590 RepID=UPI0038D057B8